MGLGKQAKTLSRTQVKMISEYLLTNRYGLRDQTIFYFSVKAGLRSKEIAHLKWSMVMNSDGSVGDYLNLPNASSKGNGGRVVPLNKDLKLNLIKLLQEHSSCQHFSPSTSAIIRTERSKSTSSQAIVNMFQRWYDRLGLVGCSSHSGRRTFITETSKKISTVGGSLRDIQMMVGHSSLQTTQRYIESDSECQRKVVDLL
ncbi:site-specific integrase [Planktomarina temperata]|nr:site-specific integrase [Planktomarina temperata]